MSNKLRNSKKQGRSNTGAALSSTAAILTAASILFMLVAALCLDGYAYYSYHGKAQIIAEEVANLVGRRSFFLGAKRPQFQSSSDATKTTKALAKKYAEHLAEVLKIPYDSFTVEVLSNERTEDNLTVTKVSLAFTNVALPFSIPGAPGGKADLSATGVASGAAEDPPAFIRFGFKLIDPSQSNPSVTNATQVVMLPAYGFQTDATNQQNLGGTQNNNDVVGNQPDPRKCLWAGVNASGDHPLRSNAPYVSGAGGKQITAFN